jgi:hypothetical protein
MKNSSAFRYKCGICDKIYTSRPSFSEHISICKNLICHHCKKRFRSFSVREFHIKNCSQKKTTHKCHCGQSFVNKGNRTQHRKTCQHYHASILISMKK